MCTYMGIYSFFFLRMSNTGRFFSRGCATQSPAPFSFFFFKNQGFTCSPVIIFTSLLRILWFPIFRTVVYIFQMNETQQPHVHEGSRKYGTPLNLSIRLFEAILNLRRRLARHKKDEGASGPPVLMHFVAAQSSSPSGRQSN